MFKFMMLLVPKDLGLQIISYNCWSFYLETSEIQTVLKTDKKVFTRLLVSVDFTSRIKMATMVLVVLQFK